MFLAHRCRNTVIMHNFNISLEIIILARELAIFSFQQISVYFATTNSSLIVFIHSFHCKGRSTPRQGVIPLITKWVWENVSAQTKHSTEYTVKYSFCSSITFLFSQILANALVWHARAGIMMPFHSRMMITPI